MIAGDKFCFDSAIVVLLLLARQALGQAPPVLPIFMTSNGNVSAPYPGTKASDGYDDVCPLIDCCSNWQPGPGTAFIPSQQTISCADVFCQNVCRFACDRSGSADTTCGTTCASSITSIEAYVFVRASGAKSLGHVGFGFLVGPGIYAFGGMEDPSNAPTVPAGEDNGFWLAFGAQQDMFCAMLLPPVDGAQPYDTNYKLFTGGPPNGCPAVLAADQYYGAGYNVNGNNCLDATYNILMGYGVPSSHLPSPTLTLLPNIWYTLLDSSWVSYSFPDETGCGVVVS